MTLQLTSDGRFLHSYDVIQPAPADVCDVASRWQCAPRFISSVRGDGGQSTLRHGAPGGAQHCAYLLGVPREPPPTAT